MQKSVVNQPVSGENTLVNEAGRGGVEAPDAALTTDATKDGIDMADADSTPGKSPAFQFYPKEFLSDANQAGMSLQETGAYIRLMCFEWNEQGKGIADDATRAARMVGATSAQMRKMWPTLRSCFETHPDRPGKMMHPRLEKERAKQAMFSRRQSDNGKKGGRPKKPKQTQPKPTANPNESSPISSLQTSVGTAPIHTPSRRNVHRNHAMCGVVCVPQDAWDGMLRRLGGDESRLRSWVGGVLEHWQRRVDAGNPVAEGDDFAFWRARWSESFGGPTQVATNDRRVESVDETAKLLAERRKWAES